MKYKTFGSEIGLTRAFKITRRPPELRRVAQGLPPVRPMKIDVMFLVPTRMGFICRTKIFHYSLFLKNRLNKTPN
jgi:hypothetical protein